MSQTKKQKEEAAAKAAGSKTGTDASKTNQGGATEQATAAKTTAGTAFDNGAPVPPGSLLNVGRVEPKFGEAGYVLKPGDPGWRETQSELPGGPFTGDKEGDDARTFDSSAGDDEPEADEPRPNSGDGEGLVFKQPGETNLPGSLRNDGEGRIKNPR